MFIKYNWNKSYICIGVINIYKLYSSFLGICSTWINNDQRHVLTDQCMIVNHRGYTWRSRHTVNTAHGQQHVWWYIHRYSLWYRTSPSKRHRWQKFQPPCISNSSLSSRFIDSRRSTTFVAIFTLDVEDAYVPVIYNIHRLQGQVSTSFIGGTVNYIHFAIYIRLYVWHLLIELVIRHIFTKEKNS